MMESIEIQKLVNNDESLESFEFVDCNGDLEIDSSESPITEVPSKFSTGLGLIISALCSIVEEQGLLVSIPVKAMATTAVGAITGSLIGGGPGLAIGSSAVTLSSNTPLIVLFFTALLPLLLHFLFLLLWWRSSRSPPSSTPLGWLCPLATQVSLRRRAVISTLREHLSGEGLSYGHSFNMDSLITSAVIAYRTSPNRSKSPKSEREKTSIREIFSQMTLQQKKELIKELLGCLKQSNVRCLILEILKNETIRNMALEILSSFLLRKMGVSLVRPK